MTTNKNSNEIVETLVSMYNQYTIENIHVKNGTFLLETIDGKYFYEIKERIEAIVNEPYYENKVKVKDLIFEINYEDIVSTYYIMPDNVRREEITEDYFNSNIEDFIDILTINHSTGEHEVINAVFHSLDPDMKYYEVKGKHFRYYPYEQHHIISTLHYEIDRNKSKRFLMKKMGLDSLPRPQTLEDSIELINVCFDSDIVIREVVVELTRNGYPSGIYDTVSNSKGTHTKKEYIEWVTFIFNSFEDSDFKKDGDGIELFWYFSSQGEAYRNWFKTINKDYSDVEESSNDNEKVTYLIERTDEQMELHQKNVEIMRERLEDVDLDAYDTETIEGALEFINLLYDHNISITRVVYGYDGILEGSLKYKIGGHDKIVVDNFFVDLFLENKEKDVTINIDLEYYVK